MKKILFFVLAAMNLSVQNFEIKKVTVADIEQKSHPRDPNAEAAILYRIGDVKFNYSMQNGFSIQTTVKTRIKIYKKEGYEWGNSEIPYYTGTTSDTREKVSISGAYTYNVVNGAIEKTKLKSDAIFDSKENKYWSQKKIAMPNVKEGSILEFEYLIDSPNIFLLPDWEFQAEIPVDYSEFKTVIPEYFVYNHNQRGAHILDITNDQRQNYILYKSKSRKEGLRTVGEDYEEKIDYFENRSVYIAKNLEALKDEKYVNNYRNYLLSISHELMMTKYPNSTVKSFSTDWNEVAKTIYDADDFGGELQKSGYFEEELGAITAGSTSQLEKAASIFSYVKSNMTWNGSHSYYCDAGVKNAFKQKTGNSAEVNLMLIAMLRKAGLSADPVLVTTRSKVVSLFPGISAFNHVICSLQIEGNDILLDATDKYSMPNILPLRDLNWHGRLIRKDGSSTEVRLMPSSPSKQNYVMAFSLTPDGNVEGKCRRQLSENHALQFRNQNVSRTPRTISNNSKRARKHRDIGLQARERTRFVQAGNGNLRVQEKRRGRGDRR